MAENYRAPPIIEAVVELRFAKPVSFEAIEKKQARFSRYYSRHDVNVDIEATFSEQQGSITQSPAGLRFRTEDELQVALVQLNALAVAQLAPYGGWNSFRDRVARDFEIYRDSFGHQQLARVGVRYINRIDVPEGEVTLSNYLNIYPAVPDLQDSVGIAFAIEATRVLADGKHLVTMRSGTIASPVPRMVSFLLDIDVYREVELPQRSDHILKLLDDMRELKNSIFEASITDKTRELFR